MQMAHSSHCYDLPNSVRSKIPKHILLLLVLTMRHALYREKMAYSLGKAFSDGIVFVGIFILYIIIGIVNEPNYYHHHKIPQFMFFPGESLWFSGFIGLILGILVMLAILRYFTSGGKLTEVTDMVPTVLLVGAIVLLIVASFLPFEMPAETNGLICFTLLIIGLIYNYAKKKNLDAIMGPLKAVDFETLGLLVGLFLMIGGISNMGVIDALAQGLAKLGAGNPFLMYTIIVWASVLISAFIDNIPYVATMIPVIAGIAAEMGIDSTALYFGLLSGATLGGNCTPIGASANITGIGILRKEGHEVSNADFFKIGIPFTLSAIIPAYILIWILFGM